MKIDYELVRQLLLKIELSADGHRVFSNMDFFVCFPDENQVKVDYHLKYLLDSGLVEGDNTICIVDITPYGREYLDNIRDDSVWKSVKERIHKLDSVALPVVSKVAESIVLKALGL